jgi:hypothetical protein
MGELQLNKDEVLSYEVYIQLDKKRVPEVFPGPFCLTTLKSI